LKRGKFFTAACIESSCFANQWTEGCQIKAINNLEDSFRRNQPKALVADGNGVRKTFTAITAIYRLLTYAKAKRVLVSGRYKKPG